MGKVNKKDNKVKGWWYTSKYIGEKLGFKEVFQFLLPFGNERLLNNVNYPVN